MQQRIRFPIIARKKCNADAGRHRDWIVRDQRYRQLNGGKQSFKKG